MWVLKLVMIIIYFGVESMIELGVRFFREFSRLFGREKVDNSKEE